MMSTASKCVENCIRAKLQKRFNPKVLQLVNESYMHNVPKDSETHFKVVIVSDEFEGMPLIKRHRLVNTILTDELKSGVHALSIVAKSPNQWKDEPVESSPNCRGGFGNTDETILNIQLINPNAGICDCNDEKCVGCFWPCETCSSTKCGHQCRINRDWKYEVWERQGRKQT